MKLIKISIASILIMFFTAALHAEISVLKVEGSAAYKEGNKWIPLRTGQKLAEGVKISTGANSYADIKLNSQNHTIRIKPFTMIQVFSKETKTDTNTHIGLKRGGIMAKVPREGNVKTIFKVSSPIATSSVRGTEENISYGPDTGMIIEVVKGVVEGTNTLGRSNTLSARQKFIQMYSKAEALNILNDVKNASIIQVYGNGLTADEIVTMLYSDDQTGSPGGDISILDNQVQNADINLKIIWP
ncbi:MAG TPA: FecR family protein [Spirochaetota bacterium]|nr:FecR family protein [Spirochaetota bacterium]